VSTPETYTWAVIFRAEIAQADDAYLATVSRLRKLALEEYGCIEFHASTEGGRETAISYWPSLEAIQAWKTDAEHREAQALGQSRWYSSYSVEVARIERAYRG